MTAGKTIALTRRTFVRKDMSLLFNMLSRLVKDQRLFGLHWSMHAKSLQSCPSLYDPMDCSPPGSSVHEILQARILEWVAGLPRCLNDKDSTCQCRRCRFHPWVGKIPWSRKWQPAPVFLPEKVQGQKSLEGYSPWGHKET